MYKEEEIKHNHIMTTFTTCLQGTEDKDSIVKTVGGMRMKGVVLKDAPSAVLGFDAATTASDDK